jgi:hypothetical protein
MLFIYFVTMKKKFSALFIALLSMTILFSCLKKDDKKQTEENLKTAMDLYLNHNPKVDTSRVKFKTLKVYYYEAKMGYICEFKVNMKEKRDSMLLDTTGIMKANVSKDFRDVTRRY